MNLSSPSFQKKRTPWVSVTLLVALLTVALPSGAREVTLLDLYSKHY
jgi:hypothetical protein